MARIKFEFIDELLVVVIVVLINFRIVFDLTFSGSFNIFEEDEICELEDVETITIAVDKFVGLCDTFELRADDSIMVFLNVAKICESFRLYSCDASEDENGPKKEYAKMFYKKGIFSSWGKIIFY